MTNKTPEELAFEAYIASKTEKALNQSDNRLLAYARRKVDEKYQQSMKKGAKVRSENEIWLRSQAEKSKKESWIINQSVGSQERSKKESWKENQQIGYEKRKADPSWQAKQKAWHESKASDPEYIKIMTETNRKTAQNPEWIRKNCKPVVCPFGIFVRVKDAAIAYENEHGGHTLTINNKIRRWLKDSKNTEWKYISYEEYILLTGKKL